MILKYLCLRMNTQAYVKYNIHKSRTSWNFPAACRPFDAVAEKFAPSLTQLNGHSILIASILHNSHTILHGYSEALIQAIYILSKIV